MKIAVGSKNPVKLASVESVVKKVWPEAEVIGVEVASGVKDQPTSDEEAIKGAITRAQNALKAMQADMAIGLEAHIVDTEHFMFTDGWVAAVHNNGRIGLGSCGRLPLPEKIAIELRKGGELGPTMDKIIGQHNTKQKQGTVGILTKGLIIRKEGFERGVIYALAPFYNPDFYQKP